MRSLDTLPSLGLRLALVSFFVNFAMEASNVFMPLYARSLGASNLKVGLVAAAYGSAYFTSSLLSGRQSDIHGRLAFIRWGLGLSVAAYLAQIFTPSATALLFARGAVGFSLGLFSAAVMAYTFENQSQIGRIASFGSLGWFAGDLAGLIIRDYHSLFIVSAASSVVALLMTRTLTESPAGRLKVLKATIPLARANARVYASVFLRQLGAMAVWGVFPLYLAGLGASQTVIAALIGLNTLVQFVGMRLVERFNPAALLRTGMLASAAVFAIYGLATHYEQLVPAQLLTAIAWSCIFIGALGYLLRVNKERGTVSGVLYSTMYLAGGVGPVLGGALAQIWGFGALMFAASGMNLLGFLTCRRLKLGPAAPQPTIPKPSTAQASD